MIIVKIMGGLGNQLFTYAFAYALAKERNTQVILDKQIYQTNYLLRKCNLDSFTIRYSKELIPFSLGHRKLANKIYNRLHDFYLKIMYHPEIICEEEQFGIQHIEINQKNLYLKGYWQNYRYFHQYRNDLINEFSLKNPSDHIKFIADKASKEMPIAMHVRRGDYKTFKGGKCLSMSYYRDALAYLKKECGYKNPIWIFTDDVDFCRKIFGEEKNIFYIAQIEGISDEEEFYIMTKCTHYIIANSTFSWWAAYLSEAKEKKVVAPVVDMWNKDFYLPNWKTIKAEIEVE